jgi:hypothetical protein
MIYFQRSLFKSFLLLLTVTLLTLPLVLFSYQYFLRPPRTQQQQVLFQGIVYQREARLSPRPIVIHLITIDLTAPGLKIFVTPGYPLKNQTETNALTTSDFLRYFNLQLAINGNYFYPFREKTPWDYYPHSGDRVIVLGEAISDGYAYSSVDANFAVLCFLANNRAQIVKTGACPADTVNAIAGRYLLLKEGKLTSSAIEPTNNNKPYPSVAAAIDRTGETLWLILVDGKQPNYSEGVTLAELSEMARKLGAQTAINLDGGGSTTLVTESDRTPKVLNAPIHTKIPMRERPVANHLGFYALPLNNR